MLRRRFAVLFPLLLLLIFLATDGLPVVAQSQSDEKSSLTEVDTSDVVDEETPVDPVDPYDRVSVATPNPNALGAKYNASNGITFKVYSSRATRVMVYIYKTASGAQDVLRYVMTKNATTQIWSATAPASSLSTYVGTGPG